MASSPVYRINKFAVPPESRTDFLDLIARTQAVIRQQAGFVRSQLMEQQSGPGIFNFVALLEFSSADVVAPIIAAVADFDRLEGIDRPALMTALGIKVDMGNYSVIEV